VVWEARALIEVDRHSRREAKSLVRDIVAQQKTKVKIGGLVLTRPLFRLISAEFTYEKRRGRESNPRIAVLQTATLPLGYPARLRDGN
jgi:hypothetical protein